MVTGGTILKKRTQQSHAGRRRAVKQGGRAIEIGVNSDLVRINEHAAGIDIGSDRHFVAVPPGSDEHPVREFGVFTGDLYEIASWLEARATALRSGRCGWADRGSRRIASLTAVTPGYRL